MGTKFWIKLVVGAVFIGALAFAQSLVNQGKPGTQGAWPVTISGSIGAGTVVSTADGGPDIPVNIIYNQRCNVAVNDIQLISTVASGIAPIAYQAYIQICNTIQNGDSVIVKCRNDGTAPVFAATNAGDVLATGDCIRYDTDGVPQCISNAVSGGYISYFQCSVGAP